MAYNGSGVFVRLYNWVSDRNAAIKIRADRMDAEMDGFATGLSTCITRNGQSTVSADLPFNNKRLMSVGDATAGTDALNRQTFEGFMRGFLGGLTLSNDVSSPNTVIDISTGVAMSDDFTTMMKLSSAITKTTGAWAVGTGNGGLDTGSVANNTWYHAFLIERPDTGVVDILLSTSVSAPTMPTNYTKKRRIGSVKTNGSAQLIAFSQSGDEFLWLTPTADIFTSTLGASAIAFPLTVPPGVKVRARLRGFASSASICNILVASQDEISVAPLVTTGNVTGVIEAVNRAVSMTLDIRTDVSRQVRAVSSAANTALQMATYGWIDTRGRDV
jgi:hypothetical protein